MTFLNCPGSFKKLEKKEERQKVLTDTEEENLSVP